MISFNLLYATTLKLKTAKSGPRASRSALIPMPSTIKMAIIASALKMNNYDDANELFRALVGARVGYSLPKAIGITNGFKRVLSYDRDNRGVLSSFGFGETAIFSENRIGIAIDVSEEDFRLVQKYLAYVRWVGDSSSLVTVTDIKDDDGSDFNFPYLSIKEIIEDGKAPEDYFLIYTKDLSKKKRLDHYMREKIRGSKLYENRILCTNYEKKWLPGNGYVLSESLVD